MNVIIGFIVIFISATTLAEGWVPIKGKNSLGEKIIANGSCDEEMIDCNDSMMKKYHIKIAKHGKTTKIYKGQFCEHDLNYYKNSKFGKFYCSSSGTSPLAGAEYKIYNDHAECSAYHYICVKGCGIHAPKKMHQDPWEC
jgi:hypothetical protein